MSEEKYYWKWKNTIIDFNTISDEKDEYSKYITKKDLVFHYLGTPDEDIHEWYNGGYSSEYNTALRYAKELGLVEDYIDYEEIRYQLQQKENIIKEVREWAKKCSCQFTNDDGELVVSEISFNIQARPCDLFKILDKENRL